MRHPIPAPRCQCCGSEMVPRSRLKPKHPRSFACQNWHCRDFDKPITRLRSDVALEALRETIAEYNK